MVHAGAPKDAYGSAVMPIYQTSTFAFENAQNGADRFAGRADGFIYTRIGNPTIRALERNVAELENGVDGVATASGMGAVSVVYMALLGAGRAPGEHGVRVRAVARPDRKALQPVRRGIQLRGHVGPGERAAPPCGRTRRWSTSSRRRTRRCSSPTSRAVSDLAHQHGALVVVDNTFASPYLQKPLDLGADVVLHSVTKFLNGHADVVGGIIVAKDPDVDEAAAHDDGDPGRATWIRTRRSW